MATAASSLHSRSAQSMKSLLLSPPTVVHRPEYDPRYVDLSPAHREYMHARLYGSKRENRFLPRSNNEAKTHTANYADEQPPQWMSTMKRDFAPKRVDRGIMTKETTSVAEDIKRSHFTLEGPDGGELILKSRTKEDFPAQDPTAVSTESYKETQKKYQRYPIIYRDEEADVEKHQSTYKDTYHKPQLRTRFRSARQNKGITHISLGTDRVSYETTSGNALRALPPIPPADYERLGYKSNVLDCPDGEAPIWKSSAREAHDNIPANLDFDSLRPDMKATIKDLRSTHFTLGNDPTLPRQSQYTASFPPQNRSSQDVTPITPRGKFVPSHVLEEYDDDRRTGRTTSQEEFKSFEVVKRHSDREHQDRKRSDGTSSICFGADTDGRYRTITSTSYSAPTTAVTRPVLHAVPTATGHNLLQHDPAEPTPQSISQTCYKGVQDPLAYRASQKQSSDSRSYLRREHFLLGDEEKEGGVTGGTCQREAFKNPMAAGDTKHIRAAGVKVGSDTLATLDVGDKTGESLVTDYETTTHSTIGAFPYAPEPPQPIVHPASTAKAYMQPDLDTPVSLLGIGSEARALTTVTRQTYIPPEVMRYTQRIVPQSMAGNR
ncbi:uncharacterized protein SPPG_02928 [Spizellomyces punctatus DAOM BR117]|uniref:Uncharacterized protein n=1 Tax=Spizellomyces punctatus (strain DAOM BR117) TaxID=645134 RepID=A0A0L0HND8_SPIPD|nr:uncharacterized protein SPPG_02928 [Spizellomyces punctatus DAOM BR117]KND02465.1 hypothetical protein SPPG_02928 [Spizellomyces punctatus DAOM BR117]|eukprot:XP_016610504.1 hypothetical protein SPPG_02928 [Spizellomyces punctatus DAOM BR117]